MTLEWVQRWYRKSGDPELRTVLEVQSAVCTFIRDYLASHRFLEMLPPIIGPVTDPGIRGARQATIDFYGRDYKVMSSAILYKQMMANSLGKVFFFSPNVRLEPLETVRTKRHLVEFFQVDIEQASASYEDAMRLAEGLVVHVLKAIKREKAEEIDALGRPLRVPSRPFKKLTHREAVDILRSDGREADPSQEISWEDEEFLSQMFEEPFFIHDYPMGSRGFYDREDAARPGILRDFDLLYPEGYGEAVSGAEREHDYERVRVRMLAIGEDPSAYGWYMDMLKDGISPSAGFGIGVERLTRFICGLDAVWEARPYPKVAGVVSP
ncbi:MAG: asparagine synthetase A [Thermoplasmata archaeon]